MKRGDRLKIVALSPRSRGEPHARLFTVLSQMV
jgi:hypothetical protein